MHTDIAACMLRGQKRRKCFITRYIGVFGQIGGQVVLIYLTELLINDIVNRITQSERSEQKRRTPGDTKHRHEKPLFIPENISCGHLGVKAEMLPYERDPFKQHLLARLGCALTHERCRTFLQCRNARRKCCRRSADYRYRGYYNEIIPSERRQSGGNVVKHRIRPGYHLRQRAEAHSHTDETSESRSKYRINEIIRHYHTVRISQCLQRTHLGALLFHHACHGSERHKCRNKEEEHWKHLGDRIYLIRISAVTVEAHIVATVGNIPRRLTDIGKLCLGILYRFFRLCQLALRVKLCSLIVLLGIG